jgi:capsular exopolysaccharide synthesis family protein
LTNYLTGAAAMEDIIRPTDIPNLYFIPAGPIPPNPNELFNSAIFENLLNQLRSEYHHVIIDSPPIIGFADGRTISTFVDGVLFVIKHHYTTRETGRLAIQLLTQNHTRILGGILTMTRLGYGGYYGYYKDYQKYYNSIHPPEDDDFSEGTRPAGP